MESWEDILGKYLSPEYISEMKENKSNVFWAWQFMDVTLFFNHQLNACPNAKSCVGKYPASLIYQIFGLRFSLTLWLKIS